MPVPSVLGQDKSTSDAPGSRRGRSIGGFFFRKDASSVQRRSNELEFQTGSCCG